LYAAGEEGEQREPQRRNRDPNRCTAPSGSAAAPPRPGEPGTTLFHTRSSQRRGAAQACACTLCNLQGVERPHFRGEPPRHEPPPREGERREPRRRRCDDCTLPVKRVSNVSRSDATAVPLRAAPPPHRRDPVNPGPLCFTPAHRSGEAQRHHVHPLIAAERRSAGVRLYALQRDGPSGNVYARAAPRAKRRSRLRY
jgi:hypothetical protein